MVRMISLMIAAFVAVTVAGAVAGAGQPEAPGGDAAGDLDQSVVLAPRFERGQRFEYRFVHRSTVGVVSAEGDLGAEVATIALRGVMRFNVLGVDETGAAAMTLVFPDMRIAREVGEGAAADAGADGAGMETAERLRTALRDAVVRIDVGADGVVSALTGLEGAHEIATEAGTHGWRLLGPFAGQHAAHELTRLFRVDDAASGFTPRSVGDEWTIESTRDITDSADLLTRTTWSLTGLEEGAGGGEREGGPGSASVRVREQSSRITARWKASAGRLVDLHDESQIDMQARAGDLDGSVVRAVVRLQIRLIESPAPDEGEAEAAP